MYIWVYILLYILVYILVYISEQKLRSSYSNDNASHLYCAQKCKTNS